MSVGKYKVGDKVVVNSLDWYNNNKDSQGVVRVPCAFVKEMARFCGRTVTIAYKGSFAYRIVEDNDNFMWSDEMFEVYKEEVPTYLKTKDVKNLPKDYAECAKIVGRDEGEILVARDVREMEAFRLRICRDAYWVLAGSWKPDWKKNTKKHCVVIRDGRVGVATTISKERRFAFPTPEMADAFGKNFKKELEACKEILENK